jgi:hypothetical protein
MEFRKEKTICIKKEENKKKKEKHQMDEEKNWPRGGW